MTLSAFDCILSMNYVQDFKGRVQCLSMQVVINNCFLS